MLHPVHRRLPRLCRTSLSADASRPERTAPPSTLDDLFAGIDEHLADL